VAGEGAAGGLTILCLHGTFGARFASSPEHAPGTLRRLQAGPTSLVASPFVSSA